MRVCALSDLHGTLPIIEPCELVIIAGDIVPLAIQRNYIKSEDWFYTTFNNYIKQLPCDKVIIVAGNHDFYLEKCPLTAINLVEWTNGKCTYLKDTLYHYISAEGKEYKIYGTPWCHRFGNWAFMTDNTKLEHIYNDIPYDLDILITHDTPSIGDLDLLPPSQWNPDWLKAGNVPLAHTITITQPNIVFCGHLHQCKEKYYKYDTTEIYNVSILDNKYNYIYEPFYIEI